MVNVTLSSIQKVLTEIKPGCPAWFGLLHPHWLLDTKGVLAALGGGDCNKVLGTDPPHWELMCSEFSGVFKTPGSSPKRAIKQQGILTTRLHTTYKEVVQNVTCGTC